MLEVLERGEFTVEEIDAMTGPAIGRPKSATFRTMDIAGLDVLSLVVKDLHARLSARERDAFKAPALLERMLAAGLLGEKSGAGFYKRVKKPNGESEILALDPSTLEYRAQAPVRLGSLEQAKSIDEVGARVRSLFLGSDRVGQFLRATLAPTLVYCADAAREVAHSLGDVDRVLQWGFGWELGPIQTIDAIGVREVVDAWRAVAGTGATTPAVPGG